MMGNVLQYAHDHHGHIAAAKAVEVGLQAGSLQYQVKRGALERVARGVYVLPEVWEDEFFTLQCRYRRGIFALETALFLHDLTDRTPQRFHMVFPKGYNLTHPKQDGVLCHVIQPAWYDTGICEVQTPAGNTVRAYEPERTLCDILRPVNHVDIQLVAEAFKQYTKRSEKNIPLLSQYAEQLHVERRVRAYLEVLL